MDLTDKMIVHYLERFKEKLLPLQMNSSLGLMYSLSNTFKSISLTAVKLSIWGEANITILSKTFILVIPDCKCVVTDCKVDYASCPI